MYDRQDAVIEDYLRLSELIGLGFSSLLIAIRFIIRGEHATLVCEMRNVENRLRHSQPSWLLSPAHVHDAQSQFSPSKLIAETRNDAE